MEGRENLFELGGILFGYSNIGWPHVCAFTSSCRLRRAGGTCAPRKAQSPTTRAGSPPRRRLPVEKEEAMFARTSDKDTRTLQPFLWGWRFPAGRFIASGGLPTALRYAPVRTQLESRVFVLVGQTTFLALAGRPGGTLVILATVNSRKPGCAVCGGWDPGPSLQGSGVLLSRAKEGAT